MASFDVKRMSELQEAQPRTALLRAPCGACTVRHLTLCATLEEQELAETSAIPSFRPWNSRPAIPWPCP